LRELGTGSTPITRIRMPPLCYLAIRLSPAWESTQHHHVVNGAGRGISRGGVAASLFLSRFLPTLPVSASPRSLSVTSVRDSIATIDRPSVSARAMIRQGHTIWNWRADAAISDGISGEKARWIHRYYFYNTRCARGPHVGRAQSTPTVRRAATPPDVPASPPRVSHPLQAARRGGGLRRVRERRVRAVAFPRKVSSSEKRGDQSVSSFLLQLSLISFQFFTRCTSKERIPSES